MRAREAAAEVMAAKHNKKGGSVYDSVALHTGADEDGYIIPLRMKSTPSFSAGSSGRPQSLTSFLPPTEGSGSAAGPSAPLRRNSRPSLRQSKVDLHVKLEDHYGTVTGANYQALAQLLEQVRPAQQFPFLFLFFG